MSDEDTTERVHIGETSFLDILLRPLSLLPWCRHVVTWTETHHFSHLATPWFFAIVCAVLKRFAPIWVAPIVYAVMTIVHVGVKELIWDRLKNRGNATQRNLDLTVRIYGVVIGWAWLLS